MPSRVLRDVLHSVTVAILSAPFISFAFLQSSRISTSSSILLESSDFFTQEKVDMNFEAHGRGNFAGKFPKPLGREVNYLSLRLTTDSHCTSRVRSVAERLPSVKFSHVYLNGYFHNDRNVSVKSLFRSVAERECLTGRKWSEPV